MFGENAEGHLTLDDVDLELLSKKHGTPVYVFSEREILKNYHRVKSAFEKKWGSNLTLAYSVKVSPLAAIVKMLSDKGAMLEVGSLGELYLAKRLGISLNRLIYTSIYKPDEALSIAITSNIGFLAADSYSDLMRINKIAKDIGVEARVLIRANPGLSMDDVVFASATPWSKTGVRIMRNARGIHDVHQDEPLNLFRRAYHLENVEPVGVHGHLGSQVTPIEYYEVFTKEIADLFIRIEAEFNLKLEVLDLGGGYPVRYDPTEDIPSIETIADMMVSVLNSAKIHSKLIIETGRYIVGNAGVLLTRVGVIKYNPVVGKIVVTDACTYSELLDSILVNWFFPMAVVNKIAKPIVEAVRIVGGTNDSLDVYDPLTNKKCRKCGGTLAKTRKRLFPSIKEGDVLAIKNAGAYTVSFNNNYCSRPIPAVLLVNRQGEEKLIRKRQTYESMFEDQLYICS